VIAYTGGEGYCLGGVALAAQFSLVKFNYCLSWFIFIFCYTNNVGLVTLNSLFVKSINRYMKEKIII